MQQFQARMQRCVQRSQDQAQESLPSQPSEKDIAKAQVTYLCSSTCMQIASSPQERMHFASAVVAPHSANFDMLLHTQLYMLPEHRFRAQDKLANSMADCADEYRKKIPKLKQDIAAQIKAHLQQQG